MHRIAATTTKRAGTGTPAGCCSRPRQRTLRATRADTSTCAGLRVDAAATPGAECAVPHPATATARATSAAFPRHDIIGPASLSQHYYDPTCRDQVARRGPPDPAGRSCIPPRSRCRGPAVDEYQLFVASAVVGGGTRALPGQVYLNLASLTGERPPAEDFPPRLDGNLDDLDEQVAARLARQAIFGPNECAPALVHPRRGRPAPRHRRQQGHAKPALPPRRSSRAPQDHHPGHPPLCLKQARVRRPARCPGPARPV